MISGRRTGIAIIKNPYAPNECELVARHLDLRFERTRRHHIHHPLGGLGGKAKGGGLEIKDHTIDRRLELLVAKGDPALHQAPIEIGKLQLQLGNLLIQKGDLPEAVA